MQALPDVARLSGRVVRILGQNPGVMTLSGTNCYLVPHASGADLTLIDTGSPEPSAPAFVKLLVNHLKETSGVIRNIVLTHHHIDHVGGLDCVLTNLDTTGAPEPRIYKYRTPYSVSSSSSTSRSVVSDEDLQEVVRRHSRNDGEIIWLEAGTDIELSTETGASSKLRVLHTPGHTADSISLWLKDTGELFVGDTILGTGSTVINDMRSYMESLRLLQSLGATTLYPGHGPHIEGQQAISAKITEYIDHRLQRESQIIKALEADPIGSASTAAELVHAIYPDLPMRAVIAAEQSITAHLDKLYADGAVGRTSEMDPQYTLLERNTTTR